MRRRDFVGECPNPGQQARRDEDGIAAEPDLTCPDSIWCLGGARLAAAYQVTSPAPERTFATRASIKSKSESRLR